MNQMILHYRVKRNRSIHRLKSKQCLTLIIKENQKSILNTVKFTTNTIINSNQLMLSSDLDAPRFIEKMCVVLERN